jgi:O-antigen/teichoic acid export membrane protein
VYAAATRYLVLGQFALLAITQVVAPKLSELLSAHRLDRAQAVYRTGTAWAMTVAWPVFWTMIVFAPVLLSVFGPGFGSAQHALVILGLAMLVGSGTGPVDTVLLMGGKSSLNLLNTVVAVVSNVSLNLLLIPRLGMTGAAIAWSVSILANNLLPLAEIWILFRLHPYGRSVLTVGAAAATCFGLIPWIARLAFGESLGVFVTVEAAAVALYATVLYARRDVLHLPVLWEAVRVRHGLGARNRQARAGGSEPEPVASASASHASFADPVGTEHDR